MAINIKPVANHREREKGVIVYPVYSRRSAGLSVGINLFPGKKTCAFNCPYCEVFPFSSNAGFSLEQMQTGLRTAITSAQEQNIPVKDICFSGNGEPTLSPAFADAFKLAEDIRAQTEASAQLVIITNGTGLLEPHIFTLLKEAALNPSVNIWLKIDAGTSSWYEKINRSAIPFNELTEKKKEFTALAPVTIQTMLCAVGESAPSQTEEKAWETLVCELAANKIYKVQLYGKARPAPEDPLASGLPLEYLEKRAASLRQAFFKLGITTPVEVYL
ncbi:MAG: hypothetical protein FWD40_04840 [Treponema sp.]|nr:hypothetical protein [Treponema sp.]